MQALTTSELFTRRALSRAAAEDAVAWAARAAILALVLGLVACSHSQAGRFQPILDQLAHAPESELPRLLHSYEKLSPPSQAILRNMVVRMIHAPSPDQRLELVAVRESRPFAMLVVHVPWRRGEGVPDLQPVLLHVAPEGVTLVGFVLPFDDIIPLLPAEEMENAVRLGVWYAESYGPAETRR